jgi:hypothetical protein
MAGLAAAATSAALYGKSILTAIGRGGSPNRLRSSTARSCGASRFPAPEWYGEEQNQHPKSVLLPVERRQTSQTHHPADDRIGIMKGMKCTKVLQLVQLRVLRLGLLQDGGVRVGGLPKSQKILVDGAGLAVSKVLQNRWLYPLRMTPMSHGLFADVYLK